MPRIRRSWFAALLGQFLVIAFALTSAAFGQAPTATESVLYSLNGTTDSLSPAAVLIQGSDGNLYGTTLGNFFTDYGSVFKVALDGTYTPALPISPEGRTAPR